MSAHAIEIIAEDYELRLRFVCHATPGADCRRRPPEGDDRESWSPDDPGLVDGECWAVEWIREAGWDDSIIADGTRGKTEVWASLPVSVGYDEGVSVRPEMPHSTLDGIRA